MYLAPIIADRLVGGITTDGVVVSVGPVQADTVADTGVSVSTTLLVPLAGSYGVERATLTLSVIGGNDQKVHDVAQEVLTLTRSFDGTTQGGHMIDAVEYVDDQYTVTEDASIIIRELSFTVDMEV